VAPLSHELTVKTNVQKYFNVHELNPLMSMSEETCFLEKANQVYLLACANYTYREDSSHYARNCNKGKIKILLQGSLMLN